MEQAVRPLGVLIGHLALGIVRMRGCAQVRYAVLQTMQLLQDPTGVDLAGIVGGLGKKESIKADAE